jgi:hypothetical protein
MLIVPVGPAGRVVGEGSNFLVVPGGGIVVVLGAVRSQRKMRFAQIGLVARVNRKIHRKWKFHSAVKDPVRVNARAGPEDPVARGGRVRRASGCWGTWRAIPDGDKYDPERDKSGRNGTDMSLFCPFGNT